MSEKPTKYLEYVLEKQAAPSPGSFKNTMKTVSDIVKPTVALGAGASLAFMSMNKWKQKIQNDTRRKALIEDLYTHDPIIKEADREDVLQYYATILNVAPSISLDKNAVRELIQNFVKFGRVDIQTIKTLADTEKSLSQTKGDGMRVTDALKLMAMGG